MTKKEIVIRILCEHTNESRDFFDWLLNMMHDSNDEMFQGLDEEVPEPAAQQIMLELKREINDLQMLFSQINYARSTDSRQNVSGLTLH